MADTNPQTATKPKTLNRPLRKFVKRTGKKALRWAASFQARQGLVPDTPFIENTHFPFLATFEADWKAIRDEVQTILKHSDAIPGFEEVSPDQYRLAQARQWKTFILYGFGQPLHKNCAAAPLTTELLRKVPNLQTACSGWPKPYKIKVFHCRACASRY